MPSNDDLQWRQIIGPARAPVVEVVDDDMAEVLRAKTEGERVNIALGLWHFARNTLRRRVAAEHPDWTQDQVYREAAKRLLHDT
ncbi:hypothetical protein NA78x_005236 [Anatilimnocola sp. NA78]|uniref:hypothetical protein n=1 Tax=Anatilimnocola sp. NA78 TaxID=3415683 RepID=UPI003CE4516B